MWPSELRDPSSNANLGRSCEGVGALRRSVWVVCPLSFIRWTSTARTSTKKKMENHVTMNANSNLFNNTKSGYYCSKTNVNIALFLLTSLPPPKLMGTRTRVYIFKAVTVSPRKGFHASRVLLPVCVTNYSSACHPCSTSNESLLGQTCGSRVWEEH